MMGRCAFLFLSLYLGSVVCGQVPFKATNITEHELDYELPKNGIELGHGENLVFAVPREFRKRTLAFARLRFRKAKQYAPANSAQWDKNNAYISFAVNSSNGWLLWRDQFGKEKRAAQRPPHKAKKSTFYNINRSGLQRVALFCRGEGDLTKAVANIHKLSLTFLGESKLGHYTKAERLFHAHVIVNSLAIKYLLDAKDGLPLEQGKQWDFQVPQKFLGRHLLYAILTHRKTPARAKEIKNEIDPHPAYLLFQARDRHSGHWHPWVDRYSSAKYSEVRRKDNPEDEILHNCLKCLGVIEPDRVSLYNQGYGNKRFSTANVHSLELVFLPNLNGVKRQEKLYTPETAFTDLQSGAVVPLFGGGPRLDGRFPGAVALGAARNRRERAISSLPEKHRFTLAKVKAPLRVDILGRLHIPLPPGEEFVQFEIALGDLDVTSLHKNKDGYFGRSGKAEITISYGKKRVPLVRNVNIGMACLIVAAPLKENTIIEEGDELLITIHRDVAFVMGWRLTTRPRDKFSTFCRP